MDVFGDAWANHSQRIAEHWRAKIQPEDLVLIAGDISWAMRQEDVIPDFLYLRELPGTKVLLKGNHDYWWSTKKKVLSLAGEGFGVVQNDAFVHEDVAIVGVRGWDMPGSRRYSDEDASILQREIGRLRLSLEAGVRSRKRMICMMHYPPLSAVDRTTPFSDLLEEFKIPLCVYGHLHGPSHRARVEGTVRGVQYHLVAADFLHFQPLEIFLPAE